MEWRPVWADDDVALARARDVLDRQHVDTSGVQVVRAADAYLLNGPQGWELAGIDVGLLSFGRRLVTRRRACPPPDRVIEWAQLHAFVPRFTGYDHGLGFRTDDRGRYRRESTAVRRTAAR